MMSKPTVSPVRVAGQNSPPRVRVRVFRADGKIAKVHPPDGEGRKLVAAAQQSSRHHVERLRERLVVSNTICMSFTLGRNF